MKITLPGKFNLFLTLLPVCLMSLQVILTGCGGENTALNFSSSPAQATVALSPVTPQGVSSGQPISKGPVNQIVTQGLGMLKSDWEKAHGAGTPVAQGIPTYEYENKKFLVTFAADRVGQITRRFDPNPLSMEMARKESLLLSPQDAKPLRNIGPSKGKDPVDIFTSETLKDAFNSIQGIPALWAGGEPGTFAVAFRPGSNNQVESIVLALGANL